MECCSNCRLLIESRRATGLHSLRWAIGDSRGSAWSWPCLVATGSFVPLVHFESVHLPQRDTDSVQTRDPAIQPTSLTLILVNEKAQGRLRGSNGFGFFGARRLTALDSSEQEKPGGSSNGTCSTYGHRRRCGNQHDNVGMQHKKIQERFRKTIQDE